MEYWIIGLIIFAALLIPILWVASKVMNFESFLDHIFKRSPKWLQCAAYGIYFAALVAVFIIYEKLTN